MKKYYFGVYLLLFGFGCGLVFLNYTNPWHKIYCGSVLPLVTWSPITTGLFLCSNVTQSIKPEYSKNISLLPQPEHPGFSVYSPLDNSQPAVFRMVVKRDRPLMYIFPRTNGVDCRVQVYEVRDELKRKLFDVRGDKNGWSPIGKRYELNIGCVEDGVNSEVFDVVLEFVLTGKWSQIWVHNHVVLF